MKRQVSKCNYLVRKKHIQTLVGYPVGLLLLALLAYVMPWFSLRPPQGMMTIGDMWLFYSVLYLPWVAMSTVHHICRRRGAS